MSPVASQQLDRELLEHTANLSPVPLPPALAAARRDIGLAAADFLAVSEGALVRPWAWRAGSEEEVRYGFYRAVELLEAAEGDARAAAESGPASSAAARLIAPSTIARWDLHGLLAGLSGEDYDADPGDGEWTVRLTLGHVISSQRAYGWGTAWWQERGFAADDPAMPPGLPEELWSTLPDEATDEAGGAPSEIRDRLDAVLDQSAERLAGLPDDRLALGARWSGFAVDIGFRLGRWSSHVQEHTVQVQKTLDMLGRRPTEVQRLVRLVLAAYGRLESVAFGSRPESVGSAPDIIAGAAAAARATAAEIRVLAGA
jgi:hypothetical protein